MNCRSLSTRSLCSWAFLHELSDKAVDMRKGRGAYTFVPMPLQPEIVPPGDKGRVVLAALGT
jgi:hypothetical protein